MQGLLTSLLLPPLGLSMLALIAGLLAWCGWRRAGLVVAFAAVAQLALGTPTVSDLLLTSLEREAAPPSGGVSPEAIIVLGGDGVRTAVGLQPGPFTLERLRAGAALHRRTGLPMLVTAGPLSPGDVALGPVMARSLSDDFNAPVRWVEGRARDTRDNAAFSAAMLREAGIGTAFLVTHGWHMPRARAAFARQGFATVAAPVYPEPTPMAGASTDWVPRPDHLAMSWFALREWVGRLVYAIRD
jgi:uncharacterized SAM-binding protein YcdF (DUF218 family)